VASHDRWANIRKPDRTIAESCSQELPPVWKADDPTRLESGQTPTPGSGSCICVETPKRFAWCLISVGLLPSDVTANRADAKTLQAIQPTSCGGGSFMADTRQTSVLSTRKIHCGSNRGNHTMSQACSLSTKALPAFCKVEFACVTATGTLLRLLALLAEIATA